MWELIRANKRNSIVLMLTMAAVLLVLGYVIGMALFGPISRATAGPGPGGYGYAPQPGANYGGIIGVIVAAVIWLVLAAISFAGGDQIFLSASKARPITKDVHPQLFNVVEEMAIAAALPMPKVYIINDPAPNAFATGRKPETASVAVTAGLLGKLNRDELQGVVAHEMSHILHRDILFVTVAGVMLGSIVLLSEVFLRGMFYSSLSSRRYSSGRGQGGGYAALVMMVVAIVAAILAPIMAYLLYYALSRRREYLADAGAARLTRYPEGLASALEKIANDPGPQLATANKVTAPMYIVNPFKKKGQVKLSDLTSTHPPISERIKILRAMTHGASFKDYSRAFSNITHKKTIVPAAVAATKEEIAIREAAAKEEKKKRVEKQLHQVGDIMRRVNGFAFLACACGLKLKVPPNYKGNTVSCPRCGRKLSVGTKSKADGS